MIEIAQEEIHPINYWPGLTARRAHKSRARVKYAWGPIRTAKSTWLCWRVYYLAKRAAVKDISLKAVILRDTYRNLEDTTLKTWFEWFPDKIMGRKSQSNPVNFMLRTPDGREHEVLFRHGQNASEASNFLSSDFGFIGLEEIAPAFTPTGEVSPGIAEEVFDMAIGRLCQKGIEDPEMALTSNPPPFHHWGSKRIIDLTPERLAEMNWAHFWFPPEENKQHLREGFYEELLKVWPIDMINRFVKGERVAIYPGLPIFAKAFSQTLHVKENLKPIPGLPLTLCVDSSGLAPAALFTQVDHKGRWLWLKELQGGYVDGKLVEQIGAKRFAAMCKVIAGELFPGFKFKVGYGDPYSLEAKSDKNEKSWAQYFASEGFRLVPGIKTIVDRIEGIEERLTTLIEGQPGLLISKSGCPLAIQALSGGYRWGVDPSASRITGREPVKDIFSHVIDAGGHGARKLFPIIKRFESAYTPRQPRSAMSA